MTIAFDNIIINLIVDFRTTCINVDFLSKVSKRESELFLIISSCFVALNILNFNVLSSLYAYSFFCFNFDINVFDASFSLAIFVSICENNFSYSIINKSNIMTIRDFRKRILTILFVVIFKSSISFCIYFFKLTSINSFIETFFVFLKSLLTILLKSFAI